MLNQEDYISFFGCETEIPINFDNLLELTIDFLDDIVICGTVSGCHNNYTLDCQEDIKKAILFQLKYVYENGGLKFFEDNSNDCDIAVSIGTYRQGRNENTKKTFGSYLKNIGLHPLTYNYLKRCGFFNRALNLYTWCPCQPNLCGSCKKPCGGSCGDTINICSGKEVAFYDT